MRNFAEKAYQFVQKIPPGKVATYGQIAKLIGQLKAARAVGNALHQNKDPNIPCHRVVNSQGKLAKNYAFGGWQKQKGKLEKEGVKVENNKINLGRYRICLRALTF